MNLDEQIKAAQAKERKRLCVLNGITEDGRLLQKLNDVDDGGIISSTPSPETMTDKVKRFFTREIF